MARILIVNDDHDLLDIAAIILRSAGHEVETVAHAIDLVACVRRAHPELIVLDWVMPGVQGDQALRSLRAHETASVPVLMMSALQGAGAASLRLGAEGFLAKPFEAEDLERAVAAVLAGAPPGAWQGRVA